jgi:hypothetical protein
VQTEFTVLAAPRFGTGVHCQFWVQIAKSSVNFHGRGESAIPAPAPIASDKKHLLSIFMTNSP